jgi:glycosyltransferase involved in cell wall biosynthesis
MLSDYASSTSPGSVGGGLTTRLRSVPIRLLVINHSTLYGGAEQNLRDLLSRLPPEEVQVLAIVAPGRGPARAVWEGIGTRCVDLPVPHFTRLPLPFFGGIRLSLQLVREFLKWIYFRRAFRELLHQEAPDLVYASSPHAAIAVEPVLACAHIPWVWQIPDLVKNRWLNRLALRPALRNSQAIMAISRATADSIVRLGADPSKVHQVYCGVDVKSIDLAAQDAGRFRVEEGIGADVPLVGMFGQVTHWKGWHILVEAIPQVMVRFPLARFVFVGRPMTEADRRYQAALEARLVDLGLDRSVRWTGFREDVPTIMTACDVIVHASVQPEPLGVVIMEGLAARKPVICTSGGGTEEVVTHNETGLAVPPGNPGALAEAVNRLLSDPPLRLQIGKKGREVVEARFTHDRRVQAYLKVFRQIVGASRG